MRLVSLVLLLALAAPCAYAEPTAVPSPLNSTLPACAVGCPRGDMTFSLTVRDIAGNPIQNSTVFLDFSDCNRPAFCSTCADDYVFFEATRTVRKFTNSSGVAQFSLCAGGETCANSLVRIYADGVLLGSVPWASPDQDGDGDVDASDLAILNGRVGSNSTDGDLDCSGTATAADVTVFNPHNFHACTGPVSSRRASWGELKLIYR